VYETQCEAPLSRREFIVRLLVHFGLAASLLLVSLGGGMLGYMYWEGLSPLDAFLNASMLLGGMGPVNPPVTNAGKLFAGCYALYSGLLFVVSASIMITPVVHRALHKFHWELDG
jgi:hypothetical protein